MPEITIITKQAGQFFTASAFVGQCFATSATSTSRGLAAEQARAAAEHLVQAGLLQPLDRPAARLGGRAKVPTFGLHVTRGCQLPLAAALAAELAAADAPPLAA